MKYVNFLFLLLYVARGFSTQPVMLDSAYQIDGIFITPHDLELVQMFKFKLHKIQQQLLLVSDTFEKQNTATLASLKEQLIQLGKTFLGDSGPTRSIIVTLIKEYVAKRSLHDSFLLDWITAKEGQEYAYFEQHITSCKALSKFCFELDVFLSDFVYSCPTARHGLQKIIEKWNKCKLIIEQLEAEHRISLTQVEKSQFLQYIKREHFVSLDVVSLDAHIIISLIKSFHGFNKQ